MYATDNYRKNKRMPFRRKGIGSIMCKAAHPRRIQNQAEKCSHGMDYL